MRIAVAVIALIVIGLTPMVAARAWVFLHPGASNGGLNVPGVLLVGGDTTSCLLLGGDGSSCLND